MGHLEILLLSLMRRERPCDYLAGTTLLYERKPKGTFVLYSVGENGRDEHALADDLV